MASIPNIFEYPHRAELETTAGEARADAPNASVARQVEENANREHQAAEQAASVAKTKGRRLTGEMSTSVDKIRNVPGQSLDQAVEEGKQDVADMKAAGAEKLELAKEMAGKATSSTKEYITPQTRQGGGTETRESAGGIIPTLQGATAGVLDTATGTLASAKTIATNTLGAVGATAQNVLGTAGTQGAQIKNVPASSTGIPATSAPLESAGKKIDTTYPSREGQDVAKMTKKDH